MATKIVMIHGRNQASDERTAADPALLQTYVTQKKLQFLAGLAKGLVLAQRPPIDASAVIFPFYGNDFAKKIAEFEAGGGIVPELESIDDEDDRLVRKYRELVESHAERFIL